MLRRIRKAKPLSQWLLGGLLIAIVIAAVLFLIYGAKPWEEGVQAAEGAGRKVKTHHFSVTALYWTSLLAMIVCAGLLLVSPWLTQPLSGDFTSEKWKAAGKGRWIGLSVIGSIAVASFFTVPRLSYSLWFDEEFMLRKQIVADYLRRDEKKQMNFLADLERREPSWRETLWFYEMPNNHPPVAVMATFTEKLAAKDLTPDRPDGYYFSEIAYRLPSWIAGMLSLAALAGMLALLGCFRAALVAPWFVALHPWFIRYASEARGYVFLFLFGPLCVIALIRALQTGRWKWWAAFGVAEFLYLWFNASGLYVLVFLNAGALIGLLAMERLSKQDRSVMIRRWFTVNVLAALAFVQMMAPCYLQLMRAFHPHPLIDELLGPEMMAAMGFCLASGMRWMPWGEPGHPYAYSLSATYGGHPVAILLFFAVLIGLLVAGAIRLWKKGGIFRWIALAFGLSMPAFYAHSYVKGLQLYEWYIVFVLPLMWALVAIGIEPVSELISRAAKVRSGGVFASFAIMLLGAFGVLTHQQRFAVREHPIEQQRESVELTRKIVNPYASGFDEVITVGFNKYTRAYDPGFYQARSYDDFLALLRMAEEEKKPLYVNYAMPDFARNVFPQIMATIDDETKFEHIATLYGLEPTSSRFVRRYITGP